MRVIDWRSLWIEWLKGGVESAIVERELGEESGQAREEEDGYEFGLAQDERFGHSWKPCCTRPRWIGYPRVVWT